MLICSLVKPRDDIFVSKASRLLPGPGNYSSPTEFDPKKFSYGVFHAKTPLREYITGLDVPHPLKYSPKFASFGQVASYNKKKSN